MYAILPDERAALGVEFPRELAGRLPLLHLTAQPQDDGLELLQEREHLKYKMMGLNGEIAKPVSSGHLYLEATFLVGQEASLNKELVHLH